MTLEPYTFKIKPMYFVGAILAGGKGERFWPLSREKNPKQFLKIVGDKELIEMSYERVAGVVREGEIIFVTTKVLEDEVKKRFPSSKVIAEPVGRNTAPACAVANRYARDKYGDCIVGVFPADHYVKEVDRFVNTLKIGIKWAEKGYFVTLGIKPTRPETGYGYIERGEELEDRVFNVVKFHEKPKREVAEKYLKSGRFYWNSGIFLWRTDIFENALKEHLPELYKLIEEHGIEGEGLYKVYENAPSISIDYGIMEKIDNMVVVETDFFWEDLGSYPALERILDKDEEGNIFLGEVVSLDSENNIAISKDGVIALLGVKDLVVVKTSDAVLVMPKEKSQDVKKILKILREKNLNKYL